jgi:hypothetical protein
MDPAAKGKKSELDLCFNVMIYAQDLWIEVLSKKTEDPLP